MASCTTTPEERAAAAAMRTSDKTSLQDKNTHFALVENLEAVEIDEGTFKYVLIRVEGQTGARHLVRGVASASYHMDAARPTVAQLETVGATYTVLGGGRIKHDPIAHEIFIYGHSYGFPWQGPCLHHISVDLCKAKYPEYSVTWSAEGY